MPVYPLTEDLFPGDIFLVQTPIDKQHKTWKAKGYLPLDNMVYRLTPEGYSKFYRDSFAPAGNLPLEWLKPGTYKNITSKSALDKTSILPSPTSTTADADTGEQVTDESPTSIIDERPWNQLAWGSAPSAAFPNYRFSVSSDSGFSAAIPINAIPIGISLIGSNRAFGSVVLSDARTYGIDTLSLANQVRGWAEKNRKFLMNYPPKKDNKNKINYNYLRVVSRVYLVGAVSVIVQTEKMRGFGASVGEPKPIDMVIGTNQADNKIESTGATAEKSDSTALNRYTKGIDALNKMLQNTYTAGQQLLPGASLKATGASDRSVSLMETFPRPLVIGYLGFDMAILPEGEIGPPIPTFAVFNNQQPLLVTASLTSTYRIISAMASTDPKAAEYKARMDNLADLLPLTYPCTIFDSDIQAYPNKQKDNPLRPAADYRYRFRILDTFNFDLDRTMNHLKTAIDTPMLNVVSLPVGSDREVYLQQQLELCQDELEKTESLLQQHSDEIQEIMRYAVSH